MNRELAEKCLELGVIELFDDLKGEPTYSLDGEYIGAADEVVRSPCVMAVLLVRCSQAVRERFQ